MPPGPYSDSVRRRLTGRLANLPPDQRAQNAADDGSGRATVLAVVAASATDRTANQCAGTGADDCARGAAAAMPVIAIAAAIIGVAVTVHLLRIVSLLLLIIALLRVIALLLVISLLTFVTLIIVLFVAATIAILIVVAVMAMGIGHTRDCD